MDCCPPKKGFAIFWKYILRLMIRDDLAQLASYIVSCLMHVHEKMSARGLEIIFLYLWKLDELCLRS